MRVLHTYCLNYNIGDYALGMGVKRLLRDNFEIDLIGETNIQGREFSEYYIKEVVNKRYDLLVIGGGGIIHGSHWPNGWFWMIEKSLIKTINIPFIVYGVGNNYFEDERIPDKAVDHLRETHKYAKYFSVRNDGSYERVIDQLSIKPHEVPDPGFHIGLNEKYERITAEPYVIVQLADDKAEQRFDKVNKDKFIKNMKIIVINLAKKYRVIFVPHVLADVYISEIISRGIENSEVLRFGEFAFDQSSRLISYYRHAEFVLAMRGHGQIIPIGFNVPVISLQNHPKHIGLMRNLGLEDYNVNISSDNFLGKLQDIITTVENNRSSIINKYHKINASNTIISNNSMKLIKESIK